MDIEKIVLGVLGAATAVAGAVAAWVKHRAKKDKPRVEPDTKVPELPARFQARAHLRVLKRACDGIRCVLIEAVRGDDDKWRFVILEEAVRDGHHSVAEAYHARQLSPWYIGAVLMQLPTGSKPLIVRESEIPDGEGLKDTYQSAGVKEGWVWVVCREGEGRAVYVTVNIPNPPKVPSAEQRKAAATAATQLRPLVPELRGAG